MTFYIKFLPDTLDLTEPEYPVVYGQIKIGDFQEDFLAPLWYWNIDKYISHWRKSLDRILRGNEKSCLITGMYDLAVANYIIWWPIYRVGDIVYLQNQYLFLEGLVSPFDEKCPYDFISDRETQNDEGQVYSEWNISIEEIEKFISGIDAQ